MLMNATNESKVTILLFPMENQNGPHMPLTGVSTIKGGVFKAGPTTSQKTEYILLLCQILGSQYAPGDGSYGPGP